MAIQSKANQLSYNLEKLSQMIANQDNGYVGDYLITGENFANGLPIGESSDVIHNDKFTMDIDAWGTSTRRVGP